MKFLNNGEPIDVDLYSLDYELHDMMNGIILDTEQHYVHLSDHIECHREFMENIPDDHPFEHFNLEGEIDWDAIPHCWVVKSIEKAIIATAEQVCKEAAE